MSKILKYILPAVGLILFLLACGGLFHYWRTVSRLEDLVKAKNVELMQSNLELGRARTKIGEADTMIKNLDKRIKSEIEAREGVLSMYGELLAKYEAEKRNIKTRTRVEYRDKLVDLPDDGLYMHDEKGYHKITSLPYEYQDFRIRIWGDALKQWLSYKLTMRFKLKLVESKLPTGAINHYAELYELDDKNKEVSRLKIEDFLVIRSPDLPSKMRWWNPKLDLMLGGGLSHKITGHWLGEVGFSTSAYGKTDDDISWRFFRIGMGITNSGPSVTFSPVQYNLGKKLPLISNFWLIPFGGYNFLDQAGIFGLGIGVVL